MAAAQGTLASKNAAPAVQPQSVSSVSPVPVRSPQPSLGSGKSPLSTASVLQTAPMLADPPAITLSGNPPTPTAATPPAASPPTSPGGSPLPSTVKAPLEKSFNTNLHAVRVHTDTNAHTVAHSLSTRAVTYGNDIFLGAGERPTDLRVMAHEAAHVVQQRGAPAVQKFTTGHGDAHEHEAEQASAAVMRGESFNVQQQTSPRPQGLFGISLPNPRNWLANQANRIPGFRMFTIILGQNPINGSPVARSAANILRALVEIIPGGSLITQALDNYGIFERVGAWVEQQIASLGMSAGAIIGAVGRFISSLRPSDLLHLGGVWDRAVRMLSEPIDRLISLGRGLVNGIIRLIKDAILMPLARLASRTRGWDLLTAVLGQNPITGEPVPRTAETLIGGFMKLINQEEVWNNIKRANAVPRAWTWFQGALGGLLGFVREIPGLFMEALRSLELMDIILLPRAFVRVGRVFGSFFGRFFSWAGQQVMSLLEIIFEVLAPEAMPYIRRAGSALRSIFTNPIGFIGNLVRAGILGFRQFSRNFLTHLRTSLISWLTGTMSGANIYIPQAFNLREIIKFVLSVLGLTWQNIRTKLVRVMGEPAVAALETGFEIVRTLVTQGPAAAWERIRESITNLQEMVMGQVMNFVRQRVVEAAITQLVTSLNPAGAFIQAVMAIYNTVMFLVERFRTISRVAMSFIDSMAAIASGSIGAAANRVEQTMAGMLTLVISFLARIARLGSVSQEVVNIVNRIRAPIDRALDRVVDWIVAQARRLGRAIVGAVRGRDTRTPEEKQRDLERAVRELRPQVAPLLRRGIPRPLLRARLAVWRMQYRLTTLTIERGEVVATINPRLTLAQGWEFPDTQVFQVIDRIAGEFVTEAHFEASAVPSDVVPRSGSHVEVVDLNRRVEPAAGVAAMSTMGPQEFRIGQTQSGTPLAFGHTIVQAPYQRDPLPPEGPWHGIGGGGAGGPQGRNYDELARSLRGQPVGDWLTRLVRRQPLPDAALPHQQHIEELYGLLMAKEPSHNEGRHRRDLVYSFMAADLMSGPQARTIGQMVGTRGLHPAAFVGAQGQARAVTAELPPRGGRRPPREGQPISERRRREREILRAWFARHRDEMPTLDHPPTIEDVETWVRTMMRTFVRPGAGTAAGPGAGTGTGSGAGSGPR